MSRDPIAAGIRQLLSERGLIQKAVAIRAGFTPQQFNDMLNDRKTIKATDIVPISRAIGVSVQEIYDAGASYVPGKAGREIRVYKDANARLTLEDFFAKLAINYG